MHFTIIYQIIEQLILVIIKHDCLHFVMARIKLSMYIRVLRVALLCLCFNYIMTKLICQWFKLHKNELVYLCNMSMCVLRVALLRLYCIITKLICQWFKLHKNELVYLCNMTTVGIPRRRERVREQDAIVLIHIKLICIV